ncbi:MAG: hypothetical protein ACR2I0_03770 [Rhodoferax sp.]
MKLELIMVDIFNVVMVIGIIVVAMGLRRAEKDLRAMRLRNAEEEDQWG